MGGGCCVGNCCVANCGFCCVFKTSCSDCCVGNCCVSNCGDTPTPKRDPEREHAAAIANELAEMRTRSAKDAKEDETRILTDVNETMADFIQWVKDVNKKKIGGKNLNINITRIEELNEELRKKIDGFIGKKLSDKIVMTDPKVSTILAEHDNAKRKKNFDAFYDKRRREAIRQLIDAVEKSVREQAEAIELEIQNRIRELNQSMAEETRAFEEIKTLKTQEDSRLGEKQIECMYYAALCDIMFNELKLSSLSGR